MKRSHLSPIAVRPIGAIPRLRPIVRRSYCPTMRQTDKPQDPLAADVAARVAGILGFSLSPWSPRHLQRLGYELVASWRPATAPDPRQTAAALVLSAWPASVRFTYSAGLVHVWAESLETL